MAWYQNWFGREEYELVYLHHDEAEAEQVIDLLERVVAPAPTERVLDVGCGRGRHARTLARRGYRVTGIDLSEEALAQARRLADEEDLAIRFLRRDMREPVCRACFDGVVNLFTAFGYFEEDADHLRALQAMAAALAPGGWLFQDFLNAPRVRRRLVPDDVTVRDGVEIRQRRRIVGQRVDKEISLRSLDPDRNGHGGTFHESVRLLTLDDFRALYHAAGLTLIDTFGDYTGAPYTPTSARLILHARKR